MDAFVNVTALVVVITVLVFVFRHLGMTGGDRG